MCRTDPGTGRDPRNEAAFQENLSRAFSDQIADARRRPQTDRSPFRERIHAFTCRGVFEKVERVYAACRK
jgi:hypothetical protein